MLVACSKGQLSHYEKWLQENYDVQCVWAGDGFEKRKKGEKPGKERDIIGMEQAEKCDVMLLNLYRVTPNDKQLGLVKRYFASGKPVVGLRKASHAFQNWLAIDREVFGARYGGHFLLQRKGLSMKVEEKGKKSPVVGAFRPFLPGGGLYSYTELAPEVEVLISGGQEGNWMPQVWSRIHAKTKARIFYARYDPSDLRKDEGCRQMIARALFWAANRKVQPGPGPDLTTRFAASDPDFKVQGEYEGELAGTGKYAAQVVARGNGKFDVYFLAGGLPGAGWDKKGRLKVPAGTKDGTVSLAGGWSGTIAAGKLSGKTKEGTAFTLKRVERSSPTLGASPPKGAVVLFDGTSADGWAGGRIVAGNLLYRGTTSKKGFATGKLHLEFRTPYQPRAGGQGRGNSGVYILGREIQVLDSFGLSGARDECGAFYGSAAPAVNMCLPPLTWQTYDVEVRPDDQGKLRATVWHNGVKVHDSYPIAGKGAKPAGIHLQDHGNPVVYRNIWFVPGPAAPGKK